MCGWDLRRKVLSRGANFLGTQRGLPKKSPTWLLWRQLATEASVLAVVECGAAAQLLLDPGVSDLTGSFRCEPSNLRGCAVPAAFAVSRARLISNSDCGVSPGCSNVRCLKS